MKAYDYLRRLWARLTGHPDRVEMTRLDAMRALLAMEDPQ